MGTKPFRLRSIDQLYPLTSLKLPIPYLFTHSPPLQTGMPL